MLALRSARIAPSAAPAGPDALRQFAGMLEVIVNEQGNVADAKIQKSVYPTFDSKLVAAAHQWKFRPATKDGQPVRYRTLVEVKLVP